ncbi:MAG: hypothetical protein R6W83_03750 [Cryobacterium sp.]
MKHVANAQVVDQIENHATGEEHPGKRNDCAQSQKNRRLQNQSENDEDSAYCRCESQGPGVTGLGVIIETSESLLIQVGLGEFSQCRHVDSSMLARDNPIQ